MPIFFVQSDHRKLAGIAVSCIKWRDFLESLPFVIYMSDFKRIFTVLALTTLGPHHRRDQLHLHRSQL